MDIEDVRAQERDRAERRQAQAVEVLGQYREPVLSIAGVPGAFDESGNGDWWGDAVNISVWDVADGERATVAQLDIYFLDSDDSVGGERAMSFEMSPDEARQIIAALQGIIDAHPDTERTWAERAGLPA